MREEEADREVEKNDEEKERKDREVRGGESRKVV